MLCIIRLLYDILKRITMIGYRWRKNISSSCWRKNKGCDDPCSDLPLYRLLPYTPSGTWLSPPSWLAIRSWTSEVSCAGSCELWTSHHRGVAARLRDFYIIALPGWTKTCCCCVVQPVYTCLVGAPTLNSTSFQYMLT